MCCVREEFDPWGCLLEGEKERAYLTDGVLLRYEKLKSLNELPFANFLYPFFFSLYYSTTYVRRLTSVVAGGRKNRFRPPPSSSSFCWHQIAALITAIKWGGLKKRKKREIPMFERALLGIILHSFLSLSSHI